MSKLVRQQVDSYPLISLRERLAIKQALDFGADHGYGNIIAWLATAWAVRLRDEQGLSEEAAIAAVSNRTPYTLPPHE